MAPSKATTSPKRFLKMGYKDSTKNNQKKTFNNFNILKLIPKNLISGTNRSGNPGEYTTQASRLNLD